MKECMMTFLIQEPTEKELSTLETHWLTCDEVWNPKKHFDDPSEQFFDGIGDDKDETVALIVDQENTPEEERFECTDHMHDNEILEKPVHLDIDLSQGKFIRTAKVDHFLNQIPSSELIPRDEFESPKTMDATANFFGQLPNMDEQPDVHPKMHQARFSKIDYDKLAPHFGYVSAEIIRQTLKQTTQLAKTTFCHSMHQHNKSLFQ